MGNKNSGTPKAVLLKIDGTQVDLDGKITRTNFFDFLDLPLDEYQGEIASLTPKQALKFRNHVVRMRAGTSAAIPMYCSGPRCPMKNCPFHESKSWPIGKNCQPPGTLVKTVAHGDVPIEELDPEKHKLVSFFRKSHQVRSNNKTGYSFSLAKRMYCGELISIETDSERHEVTYDHISTVRFSEEATTRFCVYLMRQGNHWRIGKSTVVEAMTHRVTGEEKRYMGFVNKAVGEKADAVWILGTYKTNTEALLAEEYFSVTWQNSLANPVGYYEEKLRSIGLSIHFPIWEKDNLAKNSGEVKLFARYPMHIRACNIIPEVMEVPVYSTDVSRIVDWKPIQVSRSPYTGVVYSLDVHNDYKTYFANNIATHNCVFEGIFVKTWTKEYVEQLDVDPENRADMILVNKLVELDIIDYRANIGLSGGHDEEAATLLKTNITASDDVTSETTTVHPLIEVKERVSKMRHKVLEALVSTPKEKYKKAAMLKHKEDNDIGDHFASMKNLLDKLNGTSISVDQIKKETTEKEDELVDLIDMDLDNLEE